MKKIISIIASLTIFAGIVSADNDRAVTLDRLPAEARSFIAGHFADTRLAYAKQEKDFWDVSYEVLFTNGVKIEFDRRGVWTDIECRYGTLDEALVPTAISGYVEGMYGETGYRQISRERNRYEVKLANGLELTFDKDFRLVDIDD